MTDPSSNPPGASATPGGVDWGSAQSFLASVDARLQVAEAARARASRLTGAEAALAVDEIVGALDEPRGVASLLARVHPDQRMQQAARVARQRLAELWRSVLQDAEVFDALADLPDDAGLEGARRFAERVRAEQQRAGAALSEGARDRLADLQRTLVRIGHLYRRGLADDGGSVSVSAELLGVMPAAFRASHKVDRDGNVAVVPAGEALTAVMGHCSDTDVRRRLHQAACDRGWPDNRPVVEQLLGCRAEYAELVGEEDWAALEAGRSLFRSAEGVERFLDDLDQQTYGPAQDDLDLLLARKRQDEPAAGGVEPWDWTYYRERLREDRAGSPQAMTFDASAVVAVALSVFSERLGVAIAEVTGRAIWEVQVRVFELRDGPEVLGRLYLDLFARRGKASGSATMPVRTGVRGGPPGVAALCCSMPRGGPLTHRDVVTLFHELAHAYHHLLGRGTRWCGLAGLSVPRDFAEVPPHLFERWASEPDVLARLGVAPDAAAELTDWSSIGAGLSARRQALYAAYSWTLHRGEPGDLELVSREVLARWDLFPPRPHDRLYAHFPHLVGYGAGYFAYPAAVSLARDLAGVDPRVVRQRLLEPGASVPAAELLASLTG